VFKSESLAHKLMIVEEECRKVPRRGWVEMIRKVYKVDPLVFSKYQGEIKVIPFITDYSLIDRIINHLKLTFVAERPPPAQTVYQEILMVAFSLSQASNIFNPQHKDISVSLRSV